MVFFGNQTLPFAMKRVAQVAAAIFLLAGCINSPIEIPEKGLSQALANERVAILDSVCYNLHFSIPDSLTDSVKGEAEITFQLRERPQSLVLDFTNPDSSNLKVVNVGKEINPEVVICNGHIVIPKQYLNKGENRMRLSFTSDSRTLNRNRDFLYTLNVPNKASKVFPCFDQPNIKATYTLNLSIPIRWNAVSNGSIASDSIANGKRNIAFHPSQKISTYLFAFAAGKFDKVEKTTNGMPVAIYYIQTDSLKVKKNMDAIYNQVAQSLKLMEEYTSIKYPFEKYDLVLIPSFQFGGMEHPGATYYKASKLLLDENPSLQDEMSRTNLIAHETAHMWFGDLVTMSWFNDVWLKEVFAGLFAEKITNPQYPEIDHNLLFMLSNYPRALSVDRTAGTHPIAQELENQDNAASLYGSIIYNKAPIAMRLLERKMGEEPFKQALREYLSHYSYGNATWADLLTMFQRQVKEDLGGWNQDWINGKGVPEIEILIKKDDRAAILAKNGGVANPQAFEINLLDSNSSNRIEFKALPGKIMTKSLSSETVALPNSNGMAYAIFTGDIAKQTYSASNLIQMTSLERASLLINQKELAIQKRITATGYCEFLLTFTHAEEVDILLQQSLKDIEYCFLQLLSAKERDTVVSKVEAILWDKMLAQEKPSEQLTVFKSLMRVATTKSMLSKMQTILDKNQINTHTKLSERDAMSLALELAFKIPAKSNSIINTQLKRIKSEELKAQLEFERESISWNNDTLNNLWQKLQKKENRMKEPWVSEALAYVHHPLRNEANLKMLIPALKILPEIKQTGDIFFPKSWADAVLWGYRSPKAKEQVNKLLQTNTLSPDLKLKVMQSGDLLMR